MSAKMCICVQEDHPGLEGHFTIKPAGNAKNFLTSTYMQLKSDKAKGDIRAMPNVNDSKCHWLFQIVDMHNKVFKLSTVEWPDRYIYKDKDESYITAVDDVEKAGGGVKFRLIQIL